ncbi:MAG: hypothetical protein CO183_02525 [Candidatus Zambryskibacteria bacterium CG_4_9_14_3_um_filter_42_9]|uniref:Phosphoribosylaminoimidazole-succinocarboxamide synthase n=1 Tax=Candidatus Zambryskibacteria bacterium CG22_combo_CG10-13_8_21_14_all_42_17 TaxID=1975118 RepID=A0A2H0BDC2_9BACT|nr:MAG: hypothetical protein COX06_01950 [Candidatus Zambryskibacteria bacterium CG22_combo_CG10-13_8_21_14_all_42_17]PJA36673.1 MAG: hypothetical protein CO183_02525 [Candidatus Zambryskibacteria bacterium CG_4_9_14_3_um_filter_42_9]
MPCMRFVPTLNLSLPLVYQGKIRETYSLPNGNLLVVASDRLSTHNIVHKSTVSLKGEIISALTIFWIREILDANQIQHHLIASGRNIYEYLPEKYSDNLNSLQYRAIVVKKLEMLPVEFIFRGYLAGSLYKEFYAKRRFNPYGIILPARLPRMKLFDEPLFTPTDKSETDDPLNTEEIESKYQKATEIARRSYKLIRKFLNKIGIELVDGKFELGVDNHGSILLADEIATPDSCRFCLLKDIEAGRGLAWLDKQIARNEAERIWGNGEKVPLEFSNNITLKLLCTYLEVFKLITGSTLEEFDYDYLNPSLS